MTIERNEFKRTPASDAISARRILTRRQRYDHPRDVLETALDADEKRTILASWASDLFAVESRPDLRKPPGIRIPIPCRDILDALRSLDDPEQAGSPHHDEQRLSGRSS
jgi:hypothetical protein